LPYPPAQGSEPPRLFAFLLKCLLPHEERTARLGDFEEMYTDVAGSEGPRKAARLYRAHILRSFLPLLRDRMEWSCEMIKNMLKMLYRNFTRHKAYSLINVAGLAVGMACCILIWIWIQSEWSFNRFHENKDRLFRVNYEAVFSDGRSEVSSYSFYPLARTIKESCPKVESTSRIAQRSSLVVSAPGKEDVVETRIGFVDQDFFSMFSFPLLKGAPDSVFRDRLSVVLSRSTALKHFGTRDPMGRSLRIRNQYDVIVSGVMEDMPGSSSLQFDLIFPFHLYFGPDWQETTSWGGNPLETYILLAENADAAGAERDITAAVLDRAPIPENLKVSMKIQPLGRIHLYNIEGGGLYQMLKLFGLVALVVLLIACFNFINLTTARSSNRALEVGVRKAVGARRDDLVKQFFGETVLTSLIALLAALGIAAAGLGAFSRLLEREMTIASALTWGTLSGLVVIALVSGIVAGGYPALFLSSFRPAATLRGHKKLGSRGGTFRKVLVLFQFSISILLIITTLGVSRQLKFIRGMDLGLDRDNLLWIQMQGEMANRYETLKTELLAHQGIKHVTRSAQNPSYIGSTVSKLDWEGKDPQKRISMNFEYVDYDYFETMGMELAAGRWFSREFGTDPQESFIINQRAAEIMGLSDPVGQRLQVFDQKGKIVGVVKDFHFQPLRYELAPIVIGMDPGWVKSARNLFLRIDPETSAQAMTHIREVGKKFAPEFHLPITFFNDLLDHHYRSESRTGRIIAIFTALAVVVSCLGLLGLASFLAEQRTKEIGIRKILGASSSHIALTFSLDFGRWVLLANVIAWPLGYWFLNRWMRTYSYRADMVIWLFLAAGAAAFLLAVVTVGVQTLRAATTSPARSLRYE
jgi:putative ABC transport system permease protein